MKPGTLKKGTLAILSLGVACGLAVTALGLWLIGWILLTDSLIDRSWCLEEASTNPFYCAQAFHYGKVAVILIVGVALLALFTRRVLKGFFFIPDGRNDRMKKEYRQKVMTEVLSLWIICGLAMIALFMWLFGWFILADMSIALSWCSEDVYAAPTYCDHALYYGRIAVIFVIGVAVPAYFVRRILKGSS